MWGRSRQSIISPRRCPVVEHCSRPAACAPRRRRTSPKPVQDLTAPSPQVPRSRTEGLWHPPQEPAPSNVGAPWRCQWGHGHHAIRWQSVAHLRGSVAAAGMGPPLLAPPPPVWPAPKLRQLPALWRWQKPAGAPRRARGCGPAPERPWPPPPQTWQHQIPGGHRRHQLAPTTC